MSAPSDAQRHRLPLPRPTGGAAPRTRRHDEHVRDLIEQLLFTSPGERVMRPDFGCGLLDLVFTPNSPELASALELSVQASLQRWLGELIEVEALDVVSEENVVRVHLRYVVRSTASRRDDVFEGSGPA